MKEMLSSVSPKGQVTIPAEIRRALGVKPRDKIAFRLENGAVLIAPAPSPLEDSYMAVPALRPPRSWKEVEQRVAEEQARRVAEEGAV